MFKQLSFTSRKLLSLPVIPRMSSLSMTTDTTISSSTNGMPRHMISLGDFSAKQIAALVESAASFKHKTKVEGQSFHPDQPLKGKTIALLFSKLSTRTRVACESSIAYLGGHPMFLGKGDIHLGVHESLRDNTQVISDMVDGIFARVDAHSEITSMAQHSTVPVINALCDENHPTQILADLFTIWEVFSKRKPQAKSILDVLKGVKVAWVGDSYNIIREMLTAMPKCGLDMSVCTPANYHIPEPVRKRAAQDAQAANATVEYFNDPQQALKGADVIVTDTWVSMGQESEMAQRLQDFAGYQVSMDMAKPANKDWIFLHCLPRKPEEVTDEVFYSDRSVVFQEAENRKWTIVATLNALLSK